MPEFDYKSAFEIATSQRDEVTKNLQNLQIELMIERKKNENLVREIEELKTKPIPNGKDNFTYDYADEEVKPHAQ